MTHHAQEHTTLTRLASAVNNADGSGPGMAPQPPVVPQLTGPPGCPSHHGS